jgi:hypothetical protein
MPQTSSHHAVAMPERWDFELQHELTTTHHRSMVCGQQQLGLQPWPAAAAACGIAVSFVALACEAPSAGLFSRPSASHSVSTAANGASPPLTSAAAVAAMDATSSNVFADDYEVMDPQTRNWHVCSVSRQVCALR